MSCGCNDSGIITSWIDWANTVPQNPQDIIANATLGSTQGTYLNSSTYATPPGVQTWAATPITITTQPMVTALGTDNLVSVSNVKEWTFSHLMVNLETKLTPPLKNVIFLRGGLQWQNEISLALGGSSYADIQLSYRDNAGTRGDLAGSIPVISWTGSFTLSSQWTIPLSKSVRMADDCCVWQKE